MTALSDNSFRQSLIFNLLLVVGGVIVMNSLIFSFEWSTSSSNSNIQSPSFAPPGWVIGLIWTLWFIGMAIARWIIRNIEDIDLTSEKILLDILIASCLVYPLYSLAIGSVIGGLIGNIATILLSTYTFYRLYGKSKQAAWLIFPIIPWVAFATVITLVEKYLI